jgi:hypothetical protein
MKAAGHLPIIEQEGKNWFFTAAAVMAAAFFVVREARQDCAEKPRFGKELLPFTNRREIHTSHL